MAIVVWHTVASSVLSARLSQGWLPIPCNVAQPAIMDAALRIAPQRLNP